MLLLTFDRKPAALNPDHQNVYLVGMVIPEALAAEPLHLGSVCELKTGGFVAYRAINAHAPVYERVPGISFDLLEASLSLGPAR